MKVIKGIIASEGIAIGHAFVYAKALPEIKTYSVEDIDKELTRLQKSLEEVEQNLVILESKATQKVGSEKARVFEAHRMILGDPVFRDEIENAIRKQGICAEAAVQQVAETLQAVFESMEDEIFRARAEDIKDIASQILRSLLGIKSKGLEEIEAPVILIADELYPSDTVRMDSNLVLGLVTVRGGKTSHAAILARSLGIPAIVGAGDEVLGIEAGTRIIVDGYEGQIILNPDLRVEREYLNLQQQIGLRRSKILAHVSEPAFTQDGKRIRIMANIGSLAEAEQVLRLGGEGVGLLRTEFLFLNRTTAPTEEEQFEAYVYIAQKLENHPLIIRTLDVGGDKQLSYLPPAKENNPFLGNRGIRLCLNMIDLFKTQLRAILRASHEHEIGIMFPMVTTLEEIYQVKALLSEVRDELLVRGQPCGNPKIGIMIETPAAALMADLFAKQVDFFSIGTNDLTQYTLCADRTNPYVQEIADHFHPGVLRLIHHTIEQAHKQKIPVGMCGELASDPLATPLLLGMGLDEFSMSPNSIPLVKAVVRFWSMDKAVELVQKVLNLSDAKSVVAFLRANSVITEQS
jgi:phosphotransferase system enzyme I (PtsI)